MNDTKVKAQHIANANRICLKCGKPNADQPYGVTIRSRGDRNPKTKKIGWHSRGMHKQCAEAWIERIRITPANMHEVPEITLAFKEYEDSVARGYWEIENIQNEVSRRDEYLTLVTWMYYCHEYEALRKGTAPRPLDPKILSHWKSYITKDAYHAEPYSPTVQCRTLSEIEEVRRKLSENEKLLQSCKDGIAVLKHKNVLLQRRESELKAALFTVIEGGRQKSALGSTVNARAPYDGGDAPRGA